MASRPTLSPQLAIRWYRALVRPLLFRLPPEPAQRAAEALLTLSPAWRAYQALLPRTAGLTRDIAGMRLRNPVGLAAGLDKRCAHLGSLGDFGFGYVVGGTITFTPRPGNAKPRVARLPDQEALINALGFPGDGLEAAAARLRRLRHRPASVWASVAALDDEETAQCLARLEPLVDAIELNISSPNTAGLRRYHAPEPLRALLDRLNAQRAKPLFVKLPPYRDDHARELTISLFRTCVDAGVTGVTAINTVPVDDTRMAIGRGGLSGPPIRDDMLRIVAELRQLASPGFVINACGGISNGEDAIRALEAGADTVQLYTALVYQGPGLVSAICQDLAQHALRAQGDAQTP